MTDAGAIHLVEDEAAWAIVEGRHGDPFSVLGPHKIGGAWVVTAFVPGAEALSLITGKAGKQTPMDHWGQGLFVGTLPRKGPYRLRATGNGTTWEFDDPFAFGPVLGEMDEYLLGEGTHKRLWKVLGAHLITHEGVAGTHFAVWAPNATRVSVVGDFNIWDGRRHPMRRRGATGVWEIFVPGLRRRVDLQIRDPGAGRAFVAAQGRSGGLWLGTSARQCELSCAASRATLPMQTG